MIRRMIGGLIFMILRAAGRCLAAYLLERGLNYMLTVNENGKNVSFWGALGQIALAAGCSWGMSKMSDPDNTGWAPYRNQMMMNMAGTAITFAAQQMSDMQQAASQAQSQAETTAQQ